MKNNELDDIIYIEHILIYISDIEMIISTGEKHRMAELAAIRAIEVVGEAANNLSKVLKLRYSDIPWRKIINMRNLLIHDYFEVDIEEVWNACEKDIPVLKEQILRIKKEITNAD